MQIANAVDDMSLFVAFKITDLLAGYKMRQIVCTHFFEPKKHRYIGPRKVTIRQADENTIQKIAGTVIKLIQKIVPDINPQEIFKLAEDLSVICASEIDKIDANGINAYLTNSRTDKRRYFLGGYLMYHLWTRTAETLKNYGFAAAYPHKPPPPMVLLATGFLPIPSQTQPITYNLAPKFINADLMSQVTNELSREYRAPVFQGSNYGYGGD